jgi:DNA-binding response OmpR family regulator
MLLEAAWDYSFNPGTNVIDVHVSRLRAKIEHDGEAPLLHRSRRGLPARCALTLDASRTRRPFEARSGSR